MTDRYRTGDLYGLMAEYGTAQELQDAAFRVAGRGYRDVHVYAPYPVKGVAGLFGSAKRKLARFLVAPIVFGGGVTGGLTAIVMQEYASVRDYPINVGGRPLNSWPAFVPVTFELTILGAAFAAVFALLLLNKLPQFYHPVFNSERFERASQDRFFLCAEESDRKFDLEKTRELLEKTKPLAVEEVRW